MQVISANASIAAFCQAAESGDLTTVIRLIYSAKFALKPWGTYAIKLAARNGNYTVIKLIQHAMDNPLHAKPDNQTLPPLELAEVQQYLAVLYTPGSTPAQRLSVQQLKLNALCFSIQNNYTKVAKWLLGKVAISASTAEKVLAIAIKHADTDIRDHLLIHPHLLKCLFKTQAIRLLHLAIEENRPLIVQQFMLKHNIIPSAIELPALCLAVQKGHTDMVAYLLKFEQIDPMIGDGELIHLSAKNGHRPILGLLLQHINTQLHLRLPSPYPGMFTLFDVDRAASNFEDSICGAAHNGHHGNVAQLADMIWQSYGAARPWRQLQQYSVVFNSLKVRHLARRNLLSAYCLLKKRLPKQIAKHICESSVADAQTPLTKRDIVDFGQHIKQHRI